MGLKILGIAIHAMVLNIFEFFSFLTHVLAQHLRMVLPKFVTKGSHTLLGQISVTFGNSAEPQGKKGYLLL